MAFVDEGLRKGQSVLIYSTRGLGRGVGCCAAYMMAKYGWGCDKVERLGLRQDTQISVSVCSKHLAKSAAPHIFGLPPTGAVDVWFSLDSSASVARRSPLTAAAAACFSNTTNKGVRVFRVEALGDGLEPGLDREPLPARLALAAPTAPPRARLARCRREARGRAHRRTAAARRPPPRDNSGGGGQRRRRSRAVSSGDATAGSGSEPRQAPHVAYR